MNRLTPRPSRRMKAAAVLACVCWILASPVSAQLGSLVVRMTAPAQGSTVGGTTTVSASVTMVGMISVAGVQFRLDGVDLGAEDTSAPYSIQWNTLTASNG